MSTFVLIHGGGDSGWAWHLVEAELRARGHDVVAPDLPTEDETAGLTEYADAVVNTVSAVGDRPDVIVVGHSFGGFTAPLVADRLRAATLVFVAGMVPAPGEPPNDWWANTGYANTGDDDPYVTFYHDVPRELAEESMRRERGGSEKPMGAPWPLAALPDIPTRFVLCTEDQFFPAAFMRRVVADRLQIVPDEIAAGHCVPLSRPKELADLLVGYAQPAQHGSAQPVQRGEPEPTLHYYLVDGALVVEEFVLDGTHAASALVGAVWDPAGRWRDAADTSRDMRADPAVRARTVAVDRAEAERAYTRLDGTGRLPDETALRAMFGAGVALASPPLRLGDDRAAADGTTRSVHRILFANDLTDADHRRLANEANTGRGTDRLTWELRRIGAGVAWAIDVTAHLHDHGPGADRTLRPLLMRLTGLGRRHGLLPVTIERLV